MNKEEVISLETAELAKKKGFDWDIETYYRDDSKTVYQGNAVNRNSRIEENNDLLRKIIEAQMHKRLNTPRKCKRELCENEFSYNEVKEKYGRQHATAFCSPECFEIYKEERSE